MAKWFTIFKFFIGVNMKKFLCMAIFSAFIASVFAYNPQPGGQELFSLGSPVQLTSAHSAAGSSIFPNCSDSIVQNPALPSSQERIQLDAGYTMLISSADSSSPFGSAVQLGLIVPTKMFTVSGIVNGVFSTADEMNLGKSLNLKAGLSKKIAEKLSIGINLSSGVFWGADTDWALGADLGVLYDFGSLAFMKDFKIGVSALNLGKYYTKTSIAGIDSSSYSDGFPSAFTLKGGASAVLFDLKGIKGGASVGLTVPTFQNLIMDFGLQFSIKDVAFINLAEKIDIREAANGYSDFMPSIGLFFKFNFTTNKNEYLKKHNWDTSEMVTGVAWQQKYSTMQVVSGGLNLRLGQKDEQPPVIEIFAGE